MEDSTAQKFPEISLAAPPIPAAESAVRPRLARPPGGRGDLTWNVLTVLVWLLMACMVMGFISVYVNPGSALNLLQPGRAPTLASFVVLPTMTASPQPSATVEELPTATPTSIPPTVTPSPTATLVPTETSTPGPTPTATIHSLYPFIQRGEIKVIDAATFPDHDACRLWVAGQAYDLQGAPMTGITVMLGGSLNYKALYQLSLTGTALQYGQAGYEFTVSDSPAASKDAVWVQLFDQAMIPLSSRVYFNTSGDCTQNLVLINFRQIR